MSSSERHDTNRRLGRQAVVNEGRARSVAQLVDHASAGNQAAWAELITQFDGLIRGVARRAGLSESDADDVAQMTWIRLLANIGRIREPERITGWLKTTSYNEAVSFGRRVAARQRLENRLANDPVRDRSTQSVETQLLAAEERADLNAALGTLPPDRERLVRLLVNGASYAEIRALTGLPQGSIGPTWCRSIQKLRQSPQFVEALQQRIAARDSAA